MTIRKSDKHLNKDKKKTPRKYNGPDDARRQEGAGVYPNQALVFNSRSGHNWTVDDTDGHESMTFQHRGGSAIQFQPNGAIQIVAHNSMYNLVFGQNRLSITGANDLTVKGDGSLMVYGDFNKTVHGNTNWTSTGDFNITAENMNSMIRGNIETQAKNETKKLEGSSSTTAQGAIAMASKDSLTAVSHSDQVHIGGGAGLNMFAKDGNITANIDKGNFHFEAKDGTFEAKIKSAIKFLSDSGAMHIIAQEAANILSKQGDVHINAQSGSAALSGSSGTYVESTSGSVNVRASGGTIASDATSQYHQSGQSQAYGGSNPQEATGATGTAKKAKTTTQVASDAESISKLA